MAEERSAGDGEETTAMAGRSGSREPAMATGASVPAGAALVIPLLIGCAITVVAVMLGHSFLQHQAQKRARRRARQASRQLERCLEAMMRQDYLAARQAADAAIKLARSTSGLVAGDSELQGTAYLFRAEARSGLAGREQLEAAIRDYVACLRLRPSAKNRFLALYGQGQVLYRLGRYAQAQECFTEALSVYPYSAVAYGARAMARRKLGHRQQACEDEKRALELGWSREENAIGGALRAPE